MSGTDVVVRLAVLGLLLFGASQSLAASPAMQRRVPTNFAAESQKCERTVCSAMPEDERKNCVAKCLSPPCFDEHLAEDPLEDGQVRLLVRAHIFCMHSVNQLTRFIF